MEKIGKVGICYLGSKIGDTAIDVEEIKQSYET